MNNTYLNIITSEIVEAITQRCDCEYSINYIVNEHFQCFEEQSSTCVTYRARVDGTRDQEGMVLVGYMQDWINSSSDMIQTNQSDSLLSIDTNCEVVINSFNDSLCTCMMNNNTTNRTNETASEDEITNATASEDEITNATASEDEITNATASEDEITNVTASEDEITNATASEDEITNATASEDEITNATASEGESTNETASEGESTNETASEGESTNETTSEGESTNETTSEGESTNETASDGSGLLQIIIIVGITAGVLCFVPIFCLVVILIYKYKIKSTMRQ